jgi:hypothetical protein
MKSLDPGYSAEVDETGKTEWHTLLFAFDDASFYQTWSYGETIWGARELSHIVLRRDGRPAALAQLRILRVPVLRSGIAYLNWGPLWRPAQDHGHFLHLKNMVRALRNEYVEKRGMILRIQPKIIDSGENREVKGVFLEEGYVLSPDPTRTYLVDLRPSLEQIRKNLSRSWKRSLVFAEKQNLMVIAASEPDHYRKVLDIYSQMKTRKRFFGNTQMTVLRAQEDLPDELKLKILLCLQGHETVATLGWSSLGMICMPLIGATGNQGLTSKASFLLWWELIKDAKSRHADYCDTATVHEGRNPGGHFFKQGLAGKDARESRYIGRFDAYQSLPLFLFMKTALAMREKFINAARRTRRGGSRGLPRGRRQIVPGPEK